MDSDSIDISSSILNDTITISDINTTWLTGAVGSNAYTYTGSGTNYAWNTTSIENTLQVKGDSEFDGDITVKGRSLTEFMAGPGHVIKYSGAVSVSLVGVLFS